MFDLMGYWQLLEKTTFSALVPATHFQRIHDAARELPVPELQIFGVEVRLGETTAPVDFGIPGWIQPGGKIVLAYDDIADGRWGLCTDRPPWKNVFTFFEEWSRRGSFLYGCSLKAFWLEFDLDDTEIPLPVPGVFLPPQLTRPGHVSDKGPGQKSGCRWLTDTAFPSLLGSAISEKTVAVLTRCFDAVPSEAKVFQAGIMLSRPADSVKICLADLQRNRLDGYLEAIGWPGDKGKLEKWIETLDPPPTQWQFSLGEELSPGIGFEYYARKWNRETGKAELGAFLDWLVSMGLCTIAKRDALLGLPAVFTPEHYRDYWPEDLLHMSDFLGKWAMSVVKVETEWIKLVMKPDGTFEAKAYIFLRHVWRKAR